MKSKNRCYTYFFIKGSFDPDEISKMLDLEPFEIHRIGELRKDGKTRFDCASWAFGKCDIYNFEVEKQMLTTITPLLDKINILNNLRKQYDLFLCLEVVSTISPKETTPCLAPSLEVMQFCCDTGTVLDIDLYCY